MRVLFSRISGKLCWNLSMLFLSGGFTQTLCRQYCELFLEIVKCQGINLIEMSFCFIKSGFSYVI